MNLRYSTYQIAPAMLALFIDASLLGLNARSVAAQSITVTTPFSFCVDNHAYPKGKYQFTPVSQWLVSIRNANGTNERFFEVHPEVGDPQGSVSGPAGETGKLTFRTLHGIRELTAVYVPGSDARFELTGPDLQKSNMTAQGSSGQSPCQSNGSALTRTIVASQ